MLHVKSNLSDVTSRKKTNPFMNENFLPIKPGCKFKLGVVHIRNHSLYANLGKRET